MQAQMLDAMEDAAASHWQGVWDYRPSRSGYDEMLGTDGLPRSHWRCFIDSLAENGLPELIRRWEEAKRIIRENGVTYNVYGDPQGMARPWALDPIPLFIPSEEASRLEEGLAQRARLLDAILSDLYGPQRLIQERLIPAELLFANPAFLRPCRHIPLPGKRYLHLYAANMGRSPQGQFWVLGDRTQSPSGTGYALENRIVLSRMMPDIFRDCGVERLALFFRTFRDTLRSIAPHNRENPRIVLLTPGPYTETYFEHAYLARYLGCQLVEGSDLTVRDTRVYLKQLGGLQQVDVILRRLDEDYCDPVELRGDSFLGVPGLMQAIRSGNVAVANAIGSGVVETPALLPFLPQICRHLWGEELLLPSVPSWWCGDPSARQYIMDHLHQLVIKPAFAHMRQEPIFGDRISSSDLLLLKEQIEAKPYQFVAQEISSLSTTPVLVGDRLQPRQMVLRLFLTARDDTYQMMPGGLTRVSATADTIVVSMQQGGGSKDTWVLAAGPVNPFSMLPPSTAPIPLSRGGGDLPSRMADNLFWLGRYAERSEANARLLRGILIRLSDNPIVSESIELPILLRALTHQTKSFPGFLESKAKLHDPGEEIRSLIFDPQREGGLASNLGALLRVAETVRDRLSTDMWRVLNAAAGGHTVSLMDDWPLNSTLELMNRTVLNLSAFAGLAMESMTRGQGWRFLDLGRKLERSLQIVTLLRNTLCAAMENDSSLLEAVLEIADSVMTYRRRYMSTLQAAAVIDLLLADETNPRSLAFQLTALAEDVEHLPRDPLQPMRSPEQRLMLSTLTALRLADSYQLSQVDDAQHRPHLTGLLERMQDDLPILSELITQRYLSHLQTARHLGRQLSTTDPKP